MDTSAIQELRDLYSHLFNIPVSATSFEVSVSGQHDCLQYSVMIRNNHSGYRGVTDPPNVPLTPPKQTAPSAYFNDINLAILHYTAYITGMDYSAYQDREGIPNMLAHVDKICQNKPEARSGWELIEVGRDKYHVFIENNLAKEKK